MQVDEERSLGKRGKKERKEHRGKDERRERGTGNVSEGDMLFVSYHSKFVLRDSINKLYLPYVQNGRGNRRSRRKGGGRKGDDEGERERERRIGNSRLVLFSVNK